MKKLVMCEGPNELAVMNILLEHNMLTITRDDLLDRSAFHARQIETSPPVKTALGMYPDQVEVLRVGDTMNDALKLKNGLADRIHSVSRYCTKPELEILLIIADNKLHEFERSGMRAKEFAKQHIRLGKKRYDNSTAFWYSYFGDRPDDLAAAIREYKRIKRHARDELFLADLLA